MIIVRTRLYLYRYKIVNFNSFNKLFSEALEDVYYDEDYEVAEEDETSYFEKESLSLTMSNKWISSSFLQFFYKKISFKMLKKSKLTIWNGYLTTVRISSYKKEILNNFGMHNFFS